MELKMEQLHEDAKAALRIEDTTGPSNCHTTAIEINIFYQVSL